MIPKVDSPTDRSLQLLSGASEPIATPETRPEDRAAYAAARVKQRRIEVGLRGRHVADRLGITIPKYHSFEKRFSAAAEAQYIDALARILTTTPDWIRNGDGDDAKRSPGAHVPTAVVKPDPAFLEKLALRASERRKALNLTHAEVAIHIAIKSGTFRVWERMLPQKPQVAKEARWEEALRVPPGWLRNTRIEALSPEKVFTPACQDTSGFSGEAPSLPTCVADEIRLVATWIARHAISKRTTAYDALLPREQRFVDIFCIRYGVDGEDQTTLQVIGDRYGLTRERIRQIVQTMTDRAAGLQLKTPFLDQLAQDVRPLLPSPVARLDDALRPLLGRALSILSAARFATELLGRSVVTLTNTPGDMAAPWETVAIDPRAHDPEVVRAVRDVAIRMIRSCGAAHLLFVAGAAGEELGKGVAPADALKACQVVSGFEWLIEQHSWFWFGPDNENRMLTVARKILAVADRRVDVEEIQGGMTRQRRSYYEPGRAQPYIIEVSHGVMVAALRRTPWVRNLQHDDFVLEGSVQPEEVLSEVELAAYRLLKANGGIAARRTLHKNIVDTGVTSKMGLQMCLNQSPIFIHLDRGIFSLRGARLAPESLAAASAEVGSEAQKHSKVLSLPDEHGCVSFRLILTPYIKKSAFISVPAGIARVLEEGNIPLTGSPCRRTSFA